MGRPNTALLRTKVGLRADALSAHTLGLPLRV
jgi:hypothetical protein